MNSSSTNADLVIQPKGSGAIVAQLPDGTSTGGNKRGLNSVDLQTTRTNASQVASGRASFISSGERNTASGDYSSVLGGLSNIASGDYSTTIGSGANAPNYGEVAYASGIFSSAGDAQSSWLIYRGTTVGLTSQILYLDGTSETASLPDDTTWFVTCYYVARRTDANNESSGGKFEFVIDRNTGANTTAIAGSIVETIVHEDDVNWSITAISNTTYGGPQIIASGTGGKTINWVVYAHVVQVTG